MTKRKNADSSGKVPTNAKVTRSNVEVTNPDAVAHTLDPASMKSLAECPICLEIPRDGVMLMCLNGHNVCATCKDKLDRNAGCPQGRCGFHTPPAKNFTVGNIIERCPFEWPCKYKVEADCEFKGTKQALEPHEDECVKKLISCPDYNCKEMTSLTKVVEHFANVHKREADRSESDSKYTDLLLKDGSGSGSAWPAAPFTLCKVGWMLLCSHWHEGQVFVWLWVLLDESEAERLECRIDLGRSNRTSSTAVAPVYPLAWDMQKILQDDRCMRIGAWNFNGALEKKVTNEQRRKGYSAQLSTYFTVTKKELNEM